MAWGGYFFVFLMSSTSRGTTIVSTISTRERISKSLKVVPSFPQMSDERLYVHRGSRVSAAASVGAVRSPPGSSTLRLKASHRSFYGRLPRGFPRSPIVAEKPAGDNRLPPSGRAARLKIF